MMLPLKFLARPPARRWLLCEAALALALARLLIAAVPFRIVARWLALAPQTGPCDGQLAAAVCRAVETAARHVPFQALCLPQAVAAKAMLARRGCGTTLHLGAGLTSPGTMAAHAWLEAGGQVIIGAAGKDGVTPLARFG